MNYSLRKSSDILRLFTIAILIASFSVTACKKKDDEVTPTPVAPTPPPKPNNPEPSFSDGYGTLIAIKSRTFQKIPGGTQAIDFGLAVATFYNNPTSGELIEAGNVNCNFEDLTMQTNNAYVYEPAPKDLDGIDFSSGDVKWSVTGNGAIPAINQTITTVYPEIDPVSSSKTIDKTKNYRLTTDRAWDCDSVIFMVGGIVHVEKTSTTGSTFTVKEMSSLKAGINFVQITGYNFSLEFHDSKGFYFVKETVVTQQVTIE